MQKAEKCLPSHTNHIGYFQYYLKFILIAVLQKDIEVLKWKSFT